MPVITWEKINDIMHNIKRVLAKMIAVEEKCKKIKVNAIAQMEEIENHCKIVREEAVKEIDTINEIILQYAREEDEKNG